MYLIFDTETTGLPRDNWYNWDNCRLIQLGWLVCDENYTIIKKQSYYINDMSYKSSVSAFNVHHISDEFRIINGFETKFVIKQFLCDLNNCDYLVCHSGFFDIGVILNECLIHGINVSYMNYKIVLDTKKSEYYDYKHNLFNTVKNNFEIENEIIGNPHDALFDAYLCRILMIHSNKEKMSMPIDYYYKFYGFI